MRCPNCGAKIKKGDDRCLKCGTKKLQIIKASNKEVTRARKEYQPELVVYTTIFPSDLSYKSTLLLCIFFGWFGAHLFYVKRAFKGVVMSIFAVIFLVFALPVGLFTQTGDVGFLNTMVAFLMNTNLYVIPCILGAIGIIMWTFDLVKLITKTFPVPVVLAESEK